MQIPPTLRRLGCLVFAGCLAWATMLGLMVFFEKSLIFFPAKYPAGFWDADEVAAGLGMTVEDCHFEAADGVALHGWLCRREETSAERKVLLWFHGNAGNIAQRGDMLLRLTDAVADVLIIDYRGYGRSQGAPSEAGLYLDAEAAWAYLVEERLIPSARIVLFGKSLGGPVAVHLASRRNPAGLIVQSSFTSVPNMATRHYPFVPRALIRTQLDSLSKIGGVSCPKLFVHSRDDEIVPFSMGRELFEAAAPPKTFYEVVGAGHNDTWVVGGAAYFAALREFVDSLP